jgi:hypothetical protein
VIPNIVHFVFGMSPDFGGRPWCYVHYLAVRAAAVVNQPCEIQLWVDYEPQGDWWERTLALPGVRLRRFVAPKQVFGRPLRHPAHRADVARLDILARHGGYYCDCDCIGLKPFASLPGTPAFWMGRQGGRGLCNATMGATAGAPFLARWKESYHTFRSTGQDLYWDEHSVFIPGRLATAHPTEVQIYPETFFFHPLWDRIERVFTANDGLLANSFSVHLWESQTWHWLAALTPDTLNRRSELGQFITNVLGE